MAWGFVRYSSNDRTGFVTQIDAVERRMVAGLAVELMGLLKPAKPDKEPDPLAAELGLTDLATDPVPTPDDEVLKRLLPAGYSSDESASQDFRNYTDRTLREAKIADGALVLTALSRLRFDEPDDDLWNAWAEVSERGAADIDLAAVAGEAGHEPVFVDAEDVDSWLRGLNDMRLALGVRLGLDNESSVEELVNLADDDPQAVQAALYDFLTWWQDSLLTAMLSKS